MPRMNSIFLIGPMGAGKTTVGRYLAERCGWPFYDSDHVIEQAMQRSIATLFAEYGEAWFRTIEQATIQRLATQHPIVLATGGGAVLSSDTANTLRANGIVVYLQVTPQSQLQRLQSQAGQRPLFQNANQLARLQAEREPLYAALADFCIMTDSLTPDAVAAQLWQTTQCTIKF